MRFLTVVVSVVFVGKMCSFYEKGYRKELRSPPSMIS